MIRAVEPLSGFSLMSKRRKTDIAKNLTNGPGKLTKAFGIGKDFNSMDLTDINSKVVIIDAGRLKLFPEVNKSEIVSKPRIGIKNGADELLRFYIKDNNFISKK